jgi:GT2 family glycosyltransferase
MSNMNKITVCVPAYKSGILLTRTLRSIARQTYKNFVAHIAVEPPIDDTLALIDPFLADKRFRASLNSTRLGWDANIRHLLEQVQTPFFFILPHDDLVHPRYIELLIAELEMNDDAVVAYADMHVFGNGVPYRKFVDLPRSGNREEQILAFFLAGANAVPWRGLTRSSVISQTGGFPADGFMGFAVECEWALALIANGRAIRIPRKLYFKQAHKPNEISASSSRILNQSENQLIAAWERHKNAMLSIVNQVVPNTSSLSEIILVSVEAAMYKRYFQFIGPLKSDYLRSNVLELIEHCRVLKKKGINEADRVEQMLTNCL